MQTVRTDKPENRVKFRFDYLNQKNRNSEKLIVKNDIAAFSLPNFPNVKSRKMC